ncbi:hypothetical protein D3C80_1635690 [compost metagenome]
MPCNDWKAKKSPPRKNRTELKTWRTRPYIVVASLGSTALTICHAISVAGGSANRSIISGLPSLFDPMCGSPRLDRQA